MNSLISWLLRIVLGVAIVLFVFALSQLYLANWNTEKYIKEWENQKTLISLIEQDNVISSLLPKDKKKDSTNSFDNGNLIGKLTIPRLKESYPLIYGTTIADLAKGVGVLEEGSIPGEIGHSILSGHRDTVFRDLWKVEDGDLLIVETIEGTYTYEVVNRRVVDENDQTVIVPSIDPILTLVTCYPFQYIGPAPERYIVSSKLIDRTENGLSYNK
jgi:sortase A